MPHQIVVKGGTIVDGTGAPGYIADLAIDEGRISAIGAEVGVGRQVIDAEGMVVCPGFVDLHTHLDAQISWDPALTPVCWHGVTTALLGNCGVTFAPCKPDERERLAAMMETVEGIPRDLILSGLSWDWQDYRGYLDAIEALRPAINVAGLVGHCAVRFNVMGERAVEGQATEDDRRRMARIVGQSIDGGAAGFSSSRFVNHRLPDGRSIPGTYADPIELSDIAREVAARGAVMEVAPRDALIQASLDPAGTDAAKAECEVLGKIVDEAKVRLITHIGSGEDAESGLQRRALLDRFCEGRDVAVTTQVRSAGFMFGLQSRLLVLGPGWRRLQEMKFSHRLAAVDDAEFSARLIEEAKAAQPPIMYVDMKSAFFLGPDRIPNYAPPPSGSLAAMAEARGEHWSETFLRLSRETKGLGLFSVRVINRNLDALAELLKSKHCLPSNGDAGAHVTDMMDSGWATFVLSHWVRDTGLYMLEEAIRRMTSASARLIGLKDRGTLEVGRRADVNVFDAGTVAELQPRLAHDFPGGAARYIQHSTGYKATIVNGQINVLDGEHTGARAGEVLRHAH